MEFATAQAGRLSATFRPTHLGSFTADLASIFRSAAEHAGLEYNVDTSRVPSGLVVWVDRDKYEKIVYNLLSNALKYTLAGSIAVSIHLDRIADRFVLEVRDSGIGIPSEELASVFDKFHRVTSTRGRIIEGTGIGLSYTRELVRIHKGDVTVESKLGEGSVFRISIPLGRGHLDTESVIEDSAPGEWSVTNPVSSWFSTEPFSCRLTERTFHRMTATTRPLHQTVPCLSTARGPSTT
jgi:signal transduction histidine kinase